MRKMENLLGYSERKVPKRESSKWKIGKGGRQRGLTLIVFATLLGSLFMGLIPSSAAEGIPPYAYLDYGWEFTWQDAPAVGPFTFFDASPSGDLDGTIVRYTFNFGDGTNYTETVSNAPDGNFDGIYWHTYEVGGNMYATVEVEDDEGLTGADGTWLFVNYIPVADFTFYPTDPEVDETITFDASSSFDVDGTIVSWAWSFGDGSPVEYGEVVYHSYDTADTYTVYLTVVDDYNADHPHWAEVTVSEPSQNLPPVASFYYLPIDPEIDEIIFFDATASYDPDGTIVSYEWDFGDGNTDFGQIVFHSYPAGQDYQVTLTVTDNNLTTDLDVQTVHVGSPNLPPVANFAYFPTDPETGETVTFDASSSYDPDGTIVSYEWDFGDGSPLAYGEVVYHSYDAADTYTATLTVEDNLGATDTDIQYVEVSAGSQSTDIFVYSIDFTKVYVRNKIMRLDTTVKITGDNYTGIQGAEVYGTLTGPGSLSDNYQGTTAADGTVTFEYEYFDSKGRLKPIPAGTYTFTVTSVVKTDWTYNAVKDLDNPDSIIV